MLTLLFSVLTLHSPHALAQSDARIKLISSSGNEVVMDLAKLTSELPMTNLIVKSNPAYKGASKEYEGVELFALLKKIEPTLDLKKTFWVEVTTQDGWKAPAYPSTLLISGNALLAVRESKKTRSAPLSDDGLWSLVVTPKKTLSPGPFYMVWNDKGKNPDVLPLQVATLKVSFAKPTTNR